MPKEFELGQKKWMDEVGPSWAQRAVIAGAYLLELVFDDIVRE